MRPLLPSLCLSLLTLGCTNEVTDTEGRTFTFECAASECVLSEKSDDESNAGPTHVARAEGRILVRCPAAEPGFDCRPLICEDSSACSRLGGAEFNCENGLCQAPDRELSSADKSALCLAGTGDWKRTPEQLRRVTLARGCMGDCFLPAACRKP